MILIAVLFCLALQRFLNIGGWFQASWFESYLRYLNPWLSKLDVRLIILAVIAPVLLLFVLIHFIFMWRWFGLIDLILSTVILLFCIDARDFKNTLKPYFQAIENGDMHEASNTVADFIGDASIGNMNDLHRAVTKAILLRSFERIFIGLFWFMVFGVYGVTTYFLITLLSQSALKVNTGYVELAKLATQIRSIFEWLPARLLGFTYALVGHFHKGFSYSIKQMWSSLKDTQNIVVDSGIAALDLDEDVAHADKDENNAALEIVNRSLIIWLLALVLVLIGFWL